MLRLSDLIANIPGTRVQGDGSVAVREVRDDSRQVGAGDLFVALAGTRQDGRRFVEDALGRGAVAILAEEAGAQELAVAGRAALVLVPDGRRALAEVAAARFGTRGAMTFTAVTGTNGKTTTTYLVEAIFAAAGRVPGVFGTVAYRYPGGSHEAPLTTPGALMLHGLLARMKGAGCTDVVLEATSIALDQKRLHGCAFRAAALTNLTQDHLDYHGTMARYFDAKAILFRELLTADGVSVLPVDREEGRAMKAHVSGPLLTVTTEERGADVVVLARHLDDRGTRVTLGTPMGRVEIDSPLVGDFNLANLLTAVGLSLAHGIDPETIARGVRALAGVPGRLERVANEAGVLCVVDYAHTPDALERAMAAVRPLTRGRLLVVFGCGGDRDNTKRPIMGEAAARMADLAIVTSDNPRSEVPEKIIEMVVEGVRRQPVPARDAAALATAERGYHVEVDRRTAIRHAIGAARPGDTVLIAGKGHEDYQILGSTKIHFDDREEAAAAFAARAGGRA